MNKNIAVMGGSIISFNSQKMPKERMDETPTR